MKKTFNINLAGMIFHIDDDAFKQLEAYLGTLRRQFQQTSGGDEIMNDVETRMAELFKERTSESKQVINAKDVAEVISIMGKPEDYLGEEQATQQSYTYENYNGQRKIHRDVDNRMIGGVASGLAAYFNIDTIWIRLLFIAMLIAGFGFLLYVILWIVVPAANTTAEKLQMRGKPVTLSNIENFVKEESAAVGASVSQLGDKARNYGRGGQNIVAAFFTGLFQVIKLILKFILKVMGFFLLGIGIVLIIGFISLLFIGLNIDGNFYNLAELSDILQVLAIDSGVYNGLMLGSALLLLGPLVLILYFGVRIIFGIEPLNSGVRRGIGILVLVGFIITVVSGIRLAGEFDNHSTQTNRYELLPKNGMIHLEVLKDSIYNHPDYRYRNQNWRIVEGQNIFSDVELDIRRSSTSSSYIEQHIDSQGSNQAAARSNALSPDYFLHIDTGIVVASTYFTIPPEGLYRAQDINMVIYLAEGDSIYLAEGTEKIIWDIHNVQNTHDRDMIGHTWTMTERGLFCTDCPESEMLEERWENEDEIPAPESGEDLESPEIRIEDDLLEIEERQVHQGSSEAIRLALMQSPPMPYII